MNVNVRTITNYHEEKIGYFYEEIKEAIKNCSINANIGETAVIQSVDWLTTNFRLNPGRCQYIKGNFQFLAV